MTRILWVLEDALTLALIGLCLTAMFLLMLGFLGPADLFQGGA
ncbi:hypothetical protein [Afifella sp. H1R]|nr:hypothetical protein [Afifella sp. H1R]